MGKIERGAVEALLEWYGENKRVLPWRGEPTPYETWVSEIMLQQTRVETVKPYFLRWMAAYPTAWGFDTEKEILGSHFGIKNIRKRIEYAGDKLD